MRLKREAQQILKTLPRAGEAVTIPKIAKHLGMKRRDVFANLDFLLSLGYVNIDRHEGEQTYMLSVRGLVYPQKAM